MRQSTKILIAVSAAAFAVPAIAQNQNEDTLSAADDGEWISLTGTVKSVTADNFTLDYGDDQITVEMDDYDLFSENPLAAGDKVTVSGRMDDDFHEHRSIEASSVYIPKRSEYFFASAADEEDGYYPYPIGAIEDEEWVAMTGTVTEIDGDEMTIDTGSRTFAVDGSNTLLDTSELVDVNDRVSVTGEMDDVDLFDRREIEASSVMLLTNNAS